MEKPKYTVEKPLQVWNDSTGERYEIGPDRDALDLVEIRSYDSDSKVAARIAMPQEVWEHLRQHKPEDKS